MKTSSAQHEHPPVACAHLADASVSVLSSNPSRKIDATDDATAGCPGSMTGGRILSEPWTFNRALALWTTTVRMGGDASRLAGMEQGG